MNIAKGSDSIKALMSIWIPVKRIVVAAEWIFASKRW